MSSKMLWLVTLLACALKFSSAQTSCRGRCGAEYYRGNMCQCDYNCLSFDECCRDFESQCTTKNSCKGRCGETFRRGRLCTCDSDCSRFNQCCPDYKAHCDADESTLTEDLSLGEGNDADDNSFTPDSLTPYQPNDLSDDLYAEIFPGPDSSTDGVADPQASPGPEIISGDGLTPADVLDINSTEPSLVGGDPDFGTETPLSLTNSTPTDAILVSTTVSTDPQDPTTDPDQAMVSYEPTAAPDAGILEPSSSSAPQNESTASSVVTETEEEAFPPDKPEVTSNPTHDLIGELENSQLPTTSTSSTLASAIPSEETTSSPTIESSPGNVTTSSPDVPQDIKDPLSPLISAGDPSSTATNPNKTTDDVEPDATAAGLLTSEPDLSTASPTSKPEPNPDPSAESPISKPEPNPDPNPDPSAASIASTPEPNPDPNPDPSAASIASTPEPNPDPNPDPSAASPISKPKPKPGPSAASPTSKPDTKPRQPQTQILDNLRDYQGDDSDDTNLCSGRPISGLTTLRNGTMVVFRGHYFWFLDRNLVPSAPKGITEVWGVPSPIDTVFTRCNCQGKTYIFKGGRYWRFENDALDQGYPKIIKTGFDGLQGHITAALSVPQYLRRKETVYFFKRGGMVQKYSYQYGTSPTCGNTAKHPLYTVRARMVRQAVSVLEPAIKIQKSWRGFPATITAAVSLPTNRDPEGYKYIVFSRSSAYNVRMQGERPVVAAPRPNVSPRTDNFFRCPKKS
ncbi:proteoglycan 4b [Fundulus diaphanus]